MAANSSVYSKNNLRYATTEGTVVVSLLPLNLSEYNGNMKALFYLDDVKQYKDAEGKDVFVGMVVENSENYNMRPAKRISRARDAILGSNDTLIKYAFCNDGGLNTFAKASVMQVIYKYANYIKVKFSHNAAYYSATYRAGIRVAKGSNTGDEVPILQNQPSKSVATKDYAYQPTWLNKGDVVTIYPYTQNDENMENGVYTTRKEFTPISITLDGKISFYNLLKLPSISSPLTEGTAYTAIIKDEDYTKTLGLNELFATSGGGDNDLQTSVFPTGIEGVDNIQDATFTTKLSEGYYYGVPKTLGGSEKVIVYVGTNGNVRRWYTYTPPATTYNVTTSVIYNATEPNVFSGRINVNTMAGNTKITVTVELEFYSFAGWSPADRDGGTRQDVVFSSAGNKTVTYSLPSNLLSWQKARWKVVSTTPQALNVTMNELTNPQG